MPSSLPSIICFGDSLTAGFRSPTPTDPSPGDAPYGRFLQERLTDRAVVRVSGVCGERTDEMTQRFARDVLTHKPWLAVILGGTNDLGWRIAPREIFRNLKSMYARAVEDGIQVAAITVPSIRGADDYIPGRHELNALIMGYCTTNSVLCVDLFTATAAPTAGRLAEPYSNDGLHLTESGYRLLADLLYQQIVDKNLLP